MIVRSGLHLTIDRQRPSSPIRDRLPGRIWEMSRSSGAITAGDAYWRLRADRSAIQTPSRHLDALFHKVRAFDRSTGPGDYRDSDPEPPTP